MYKEISISHYFHYFCKTLFVNNIQMNRIKEILDKKGIRQTWLAKQLGKSFNMVNAYAQNRRQPPMEVLYKIAEILDVEVADLLVAKKDLKK